MSRTFVPILFFIAMLGLAALMTTADGLDGTRDALPKYPAGTFIPVE